jgi:iron-sulfur cluster assembly accessory protein
MVTLSEKAASELKSIMDQNGGTFVGVRVFVAGGGCSGLQYGMQIADEAPSAEDLVFEHDGVKVIVDSQSHQHLEGASIDFDDSLQGFKINNPNAVKSCGCGNSFSSGEEAGAQGGGCGSGGGSGGGGGCGCGGH